MYIKLVICLLLLENVGLISIRTLGAYDFFESICDALQNNNNIQLDEHQQQWAKICHDLYSSKEDDQDVRQQREGDGRKC